ncbi:MAG: oligosaccharide flippase family protein [Actinomycetota bacterium]|nr:oligosaccharide flippase family protein [Actinomycetota bacterium]
METEALAAAQASGPGPVTRRAARNAAAVGAAQLAGKVASLAYTIAAVRVLGERQFGTFAYAMSLCLLLGTLPEWGFDPLLLQRGSREPRSLSRFLSETLVWRTAIAVPVFGAAAIAALVTRHDATSATVFLLILLATAFDTYTDAGLAAAAALQKQVWSNISLTIERFVMAGLAIAALALGFGLVGLAISYLVGSVVGGLGVLVSVRRLGVSLDFRSVNRKGLGATARMSFAIGLDTVVSLALFRIDQVILGALKGDAAVGIYAAAYRLLETVLFVSWAVAKAVFPVMSASTSTETWRVRRGVEQGLAAVGLLYIPFGVGLLVEAGPVLRLLYGNAFAVQGAGAARWLAPAPLLFAAAYLGSYALLARERRWQVVATSLLALVVNVAANLLLIPAFSSSGAAAATTISYLVQTIVVLAVVAPDVGMPRLGRGLAAPAVAAGAMAAVLVVLRAGPAVEIPLGVAVYFAAWYPLARWWSPEHLAVVASFLPARSRRTRTPEPTPGSGSAPS